MVTFNVPNTVAAIVNWTLGSRIDHLSSVQRATGIIV
jgi:hypothetical protein